MAESYNLENIHILLTKGLNDEELRMICYDVAGFEKVYQQLNQNTTKTEIVNQLIKHGEQNSQLETILTWVKERNPTQYRKYQPYSFINFNPDGFPLNEPYYRLPEREKNIEAIINVLSDPTGRSVVLITGLGGIGKTALSAELVRRCSQEPGLPFRAITWDSAKQELFIDGEIVKIQEATMVFSDLMNSLGRQLIGPNFLQRTEQERERLLKDILHTTPCLIVVDNLETATSAKNILFNLQKLLGKSRAIITSREKVRGDVFEIRLQGLSEASAITFLREEIQKRNAEKLANASEDVLREIHQTTEGMPLAMKLIVSQVEILGLDRTMENLKKGRGQIYFFIFRQAWDLLSDEAKNLLQYVGFQLNAVSRKELEMVLDIRDELLDEAIDKLIRLSLLNVQFLEGLKQPGYSVHQLTRYFVVNDLPAYWKKQGLI